MDAGKPEGVSWALGAQFLDIGLAFKKRRMNDGCRSADGRLRRTTPLAISVCHLPIQSVHRAVLTDPGERELDRLAVDGLPAARSLGVAPEPRPQQGHRARAPRRGRANRCLRTVMYLTERHMKRIVLG